MFEQDFLGFISPLLILWEYCIGWEAQREVEPSDKLLPESQGGAEVHERNAEDIDGEGRKNVAAEVTPLMILTTLLISVSLYRPSSAQESSRPRSWRCWSLARPGRGALQCLARSWAQWWISARRQSRQWHKCGNGEDYDTEDREHVYGQGGPTRFNIRNWSTVHTAYSVIGYSDKSDIVSTLGWYGIPYTNNYWI